MSGNSPSAQKELSQKLTKKNMETLIIMYAAKIALCLMLIPLYREYKKKQIRKLKVQQWRKKIFIKEISQSRNGLYDGARNALRPCAEKEFAQSTLF